jgi:hypothetical protein
MAVFLRELRLERFAERRAAQILHVGPCAAEAPTIEQFLHASRRATGSGTITGR